MAVRLAIPTRSVLLERAIAAVAAIAVLTLHDAPSAQAKPPTHRRRSAPRILAKKPPPPPLEGRSFDFSYDGGPDGHPERSYAARIFVHNKTAQAMESVPILVFLHGTNADKVKYRWMGGGQEGDLRRMVSDLIEAGDVPPMLVAAPSSSDPNTMVNAMTSWPAFHLDEFLDRARSRLAGTALIDPTRIIVAGHSGGGCNPKGGLLSALRTTKTPVFAGMAIDSCMLSDEAVGLAHAKPMTNIIVSWQTMSWTSRGFSDFKALFQREAKKAPAAPGILRELGSEQPTEPMPHDAMVALSLKKWLPKLLGPKANAAIQGPAPAAKDGG